MLGSYATVDTTLNAGPSRHVFSSTNRFELQSTWDNTSFSGVVFPLWPWTQFHHIPLIARFIPALHGSRHSRSRARSPPSLAATRATRTFIWVLSRRLVAFAFRRCPMRRHLDLMLVPCGALSQCHACRGRAHLPLPCPLMAARRACIHARPHRFAAAGPRAHAHSPVEAHSETPPRSTVHDVSRTHAHLVRPLLRLPMITSTAPCHRVPKSKGP